MGPRPRPRLSTLAAPRPVAALVMALAALVIVACGSGASNLPSALGGPPGAPSLVVQDDASLLFRPGREVARTLDLLRSIGTRGVRVTASWGALAPSPRARTAPRFDATDPDAYSAAGWTPIDRAVRGARERGMAAMVDIAFWAPVWATGGDTREHPRRAIDPARYAAFARAVARRYSGSFTPRGASEPAPRADVFTLWNEPNLGGFLEPQSANGRPFAPHLYRAMVAAAEPAVRDEAPGATILVGALAGYGREAGIEPLRFLREMACVDGALRPLRVPECRGFERVPGDGLAFHPYSIRTTPDRAEPGAAPDQIPLARLPRLSALLDRLAAAGRLSPRLRDIYITEYGYETDPPDPGARFDPEQAAANSAWAERLAAALPRVRTVAQFLVRDLVPGREGSGGPGKLADWQSGFQFADGRPKPLEAMLAAPLAVEGVAHDRARLWARVRPGGGRRAIRVETRAPAGSWRVLYEGQTDERGVLERDVASPAGALFRVARRAGDRWLRGPPVAAN